MRQGVTAIVGLALVFAACGGTPGGAGPADSAPAIATPSSTQPDAQEPSDPSSTTTAEVPVEIEDVQPAVGISFTAADRYSPGARAGGDRSGFVPLDDPPMVPASEATWLDGSDIVMGVLAPGGEAHAFPISQMVYHHIANVTVAGEPYLVTY